jgi:hypothetical protein
MLLAQPSSEQRSERAQPRRAAPELQRSRAKPGSLVLRAAARSSHKQGRPQHSYHRTPPYKLYTQRRVTSQLPAQRLLLHATGRHGCWSRLRRRT